MKILVIKLGALGDVINTLPVVVNMHRHFNAEIHWLVAPLSLPILTGHPSVGKTVVFDRRRLKESLPQLLRAIRATEYDIIIDFQRILKSALFCMAARGRRRIGFDTNRCKEMTGLFPFERIPPGDPDSHMLTQYMEFGEYLGVPCSRVSWNIPRFENHGLQLPAEYIVLNIGATKQPNRWPSDRFAELADRIHESFRMPCVITGGPEDRGDAVVVQNRARSEIINLAGRTSLTELVEIIARAECVITADTGPMHLACGLGTNLIALFGPSDPSRTGPFRGTVIKSRVPCGPCNKKECSTPVCMERIGTGEVMDRLAGILHMS